MASIPAVGSRISVSSDLATVRFVGQVEGTKGTWLGVEWDNPKRGKHSGNKDGKQYFTCKIPNSASFIRPSASINLGHSFLRALSSKYVETPFETSMERVVLGSSKGAIEVEAIGMNKVRSKLSRLERLREVSLDMENVAYADDPGQIRLRCPNIKGLDLSRNLLPTWDAVAQIAAELPILETLTLNYNRLELPVQDNFGSAFTHLRDLRLNGTFIAWCDILQLLPSFPELLHLELGLNNIPGLIAPISFVTSGVATINLEGNQLNQWQSMMEALVYFKRLDRLILSENNIQNISPPYGPSDKLDQMKHIALASNSLREWPDIDALFMWFPHLQNLNINSNPISQGTSARPLIIARTSTLKTLNASGISAAERRDSELFYLSYIAKNGPSSEEQRQRLYPRYIELCDKHGRPDEYQELPPDTLKNRLVGMLFFRLSQPILPNTEIALSIPEFTLRVLPTMSLGVLRLKVLKTLKMPPRTKIQMWLALEREELMDFAELDMGLADRPLEWWGADENSKIAYYVQ